MELWAALSVDGTKEREFVNWALMENVKRGPVLLESFRTFLLR